MTRRRRLVKEAGRSNLTLRVFVDESREPIRRRSRAVREGGRSLDDRFSPLVVLIRTMSKTEH